MVGSSGSTDFSGSVSVNYISMANGLLENCNTITFFDNNTVRTGINNTNNYLSRNNVMYGTDNTVNDENQIIYGVNNSIKNTSTSSRVFGNNNIEIENINGNIFGSNNVVSGEGNLQCFGNNNSCKKLCASAFGSDIINETSHSVCIGDNAIRTIFPNSLICDLGRVSVPFNIICEWYNL